MCPKYARMHRRQIVGSRYIILSTSSIDTLVRWAIYCVRNILHQYHIFNASIRSDDFMVHDSEPFKNVDSGYESMHPNFC